MLLARAVHNESIGALEGAKDLGKMQLAAQRTAPSKHASKGEACPLPYLCGRLACVGRARLPHLGCVLLDWPAACLWRLLPSQLQEARAILAALLQ